MERFIGEKFFLYKVVDKEFKIQYGEIYSQ